MKKKLLFISLLLFGAVILSGCGFKSAGHYYKNGRNFFKEGDYEKAIINYELALDKNPNRADIYIDYGISLMAMGEYEKAAKQLDLAFLNKEILIVRENNKKVHTAYGTIHYNLMDYDRAILEFDQALDMDVLPELDMDILYYKGLSQEKQGLYDEALESFSKIINGDEKNQMAYAARASVYTKLGEYDKGLEDYDQALLLDSGQISLYFGKHSLLKQMGNDQGAIEVLQKADEIEVVTTKDQYNKARIHFYQGNYDTALEEFFGVVEDGFSEGYFYIGEIYFDKKDYARAINYYEEYIDGGNVDSASVYNQLGLCLIKTGDYKKALKVLEEGIMFKDAFAMKSLKHNEIVALEYVGNFDEALNKLIDYKKDYPEEEASKNEEMFLRSRMEKIQVDTTEMDGDLDSDSQVDEP